ncbi:hypothetical protein [Paenibacillus eucommiae]|uniref:Uncharacterized protein n=1 Tax=Paenibacillus eucommiae TaxID=1355755 RepID=A0ABS4ITA3_9BACL|nr:hypothetical protein [Paenibacillus eucommiae]MBP1990801.1 hypothetical protein [Paenibacillus eucommiae]
MAWKCVLELNEHRGRVEGSEEALRDSISAGADLRIETNFKHNEHIDVESDNKELVGEVSEFRTTYVLDGRWVAGCMTLRQPVNIPIGFVARPSLSLFLYNQNGQQAIARPYLDGGAVTGELGSSPLDDHHDMPKYHQLDSWDAGTNAPSSNFIYDFGKFRYWVNDEWEEVLSHDADGHVVGGSYEQLVGAFHSGREVKVGVRGICQDLMNDGEASMEHELFTQVGFTYNYTEQKLFLGETHPIVRVQPAIPLMYQSKNWDYGWLMPRTDGYVAMLLLNPYTLQYERKEGHYPIRWFVK